MENRVEIKDKNEEREQLEEVIAKIKQSPSYVLYLLNEEEGKWAGGIARGIKKYWPYLACFAAGYITAWIIEIF